MEIPEAVGDRSRALLPASYPAAKEPPKAGASNCPVNSFLFPSQSPLRPFHAGHPRGHRGILWELLSPPPKTDREVPTLFLPGVRGSLRPVGAAVKCRRPGATAVPSLSLHLLLRPHLLVSPQRRAGEPVWGPRLQTSLRSRLSLLWRAEGGELEPQPSRARLGPGNPLTPQLTPTRSDARL